LALSDPQSVTIAAVPISLPRTGSGQNSGTFTSNDGLVQMTVTSTYGKRIRRALRLSHSKVAPDPLISSTNVKYQGSFTVVADFPLTGYTVAQQKEILDGFIAALSASSGALITKFLGGEN